MPLPSEGTYYETVISLSDVIAVFLVCPLVFHFVPVTLIPTSSWLNAPYFPERIIPHLSPTTLSLSGIFRLCVSCIIPYRRLSLSTILFTLC